MNLKKQLATKNACYIKGDKIKPMGIVVHSTGANNPYLKRYVGPDDGLLGKNQYNNHWNQPMSRRVCVHAFIGKLADGSIATYQTLPWTMRGWHAGSGKNGSANDGYIGFEICEDNTLNANYAKQTYQEAVEFCAYLVKLYPAIKYENIIGHYEAAARGIASNHGDPQHWWKKHKLSMDQFRKDVKSKVEAGEKPKPTPPKAETVRLTAGTPYYKQPDGKTIAGKIEITTNYTIVGLSGNYGKLKSGAGWVKLADDPAPPTPVTGHLKAWADRNSIKRGTKGKHVEVLQAILYDKGYDIRQVDGNFGAVTENAVKAYQKDQKLTVDGWVGAQVWAALTEQK